MSSLTQPESLDGRRLKVEQNVAKLRSSLNHWATWELEYASLKEELENAGSPSATEMSKIGRDLKGTLLAEKEVQELIGPGTNRSAAQVVNMISRRIDYVHQNLATVEKQLDAAKKQLAGATLLTDPGIENEDGLPMMDIEEELDEDENVVSSSVSQAGTVAPELVEALKKAGLHKAAESDQSVLREKRDHQHINSLLSTCNDSNERNKSDAVVDEIQERPENPSKAAPAKKTVSFANKIDVKTFEKPAVFKDDLRNWNLKPGSHVYELDDNEDILAKYSVPQDEGEEADYLRRDMLAYGLSEVGQVVAELDLEEEDQLASDDEADSDESEPEDEHGRSMDYGLSEQYREQMRQLEEKLNVRMLENIGPQPLLGVHEPASSIEETLPTAVTKGMTTAVSLPQKTPAMSDVMERSLPASQPPTAPSEPAKAPNLRSPHAAAGPVMLASPSQESAPMPTGPTGRTLATSVVERVPQAEPVRPPDELDSVLHQREVQSEYHRMRNKMIQRQGGFVETEQDRRDPLMEVSQDGHVKKISRFKAARLAANGL